MKRFALAIFIALFGASSAQAAVLHLNLSVLLEGPVARAAYRERGVVVEFVPTAVASRFNLHDTFQYLFTASDLEAVEFIVANGAGQYGYARVQGIDGESAGDIAMTPDDGSAVPEPASLLLLGTGLIAGVRWLRKRSKPFTPVRA